MDLERQAYEAYPASFAKRIRVGISRPQAKKANWICRRCDPLVFLHDCFERWHKSVPDDAALSSTSTKSADDSSDEEDAFENHCAERPVLSRGDDGQRQLSWIWQ